MSTWTRAACKYSDREQFQSLFADASQRQFDMVLFWSLDRFSREGVRETLNHLKRLDNYGVGYRSFTEQYLDSCGIFKDAVLAILAVIAKQERVRLSERTLAGFERAVRQGRVGSRPKVVCDRLRVQRLHQAGKSLGEVGVSKSSGSSNTDDVSNPVRRRRQGDVRGTANNWPAVGCCGAMKLRLRETGMSWRRIRGGIRPAGVVEGCRVGGYSVCCRSLEIWCLNWRHRCVCGKWIGAVRKGRLMYGNAT
jgi:DNA invertase Pin-like site-specific DNA recombinase